jgi:hypothetical protein
MQFGESAPIVVSASPFYCDMLGSLGGVRKCVLPILACFCPAAHQGFNRARVELFGSDTRNGAGLFRKGHQLAEARANISVV